MSLENTFSEAEWNRVYDRVLPNSATQEEFKTYFIEGTLHEHYSSVELKKFCAEVKEIVRERGELREANNLQTSRRKEDMSKAMREVLVRLAAERDKTVEAASTTTDVQESRHSLPLPRRTVPTVTPSADVIPFPTVTHVNSKIHLSTDQAPNSDSKESSSSVPRLSLRPIASSSQDTGEDCSVFRPNCSPFLNLMRVLGRFQMRFGSNTFRFEVPVQYEEAIASRRLRALIFPVRHPNIPSSWPTAKDVIVYVNNTVYREPWKRTWPAREKVARSFLPLDITAYLRRRGNASRQGEFQNLLLDVLNKDYFSVGVVVIAEPLGLEEVAEKFFTKALASPVHLTPRVVEEHLGEDQTLPEGEAMTEVLSRNDSRIGHFYRKVMEQELEDGLEADDPIVTTKCPISQATMQVPVRGTNCGHLQCFDMSAFLLGGSRSYYWNCPLCDEPVDLMVDTILWRYLVRERNATYLRLHKEGSAYTWQSSRRGGGMTDLQVDDSFDEEAGEEDEGKNSLTTETEVVRGGDLHLKRPREEEGSADCPIEL